MDALCLQTKIKIPKSSSQFTVPYFRKNSVIPFNNITHHHSQKRTGFGIKYPSKHISAPLHCICVASVAKKDSNKEESQTRRKNLCVFVSGGGSNFKALHRASMGNHIHGTVQLLVTDKPGCKAADYARECGIPVVTFPKNKSVPNGLSSADLIEMMRSFEVDYILLAGFLKILPSDVVEAFPKSILNIHPSLLPAFGGKGYYGMKVHAAVISSGARFSGATIHFVDQNYDTGKILAQRVVPVLPDDTPDDLAARVLHQEHSLYVEVVGALCEGRIHWREDGVPMIRKSLDSDKFY